MKCTRCGREFEGNFCPNCGLRPEISAPTCPECGSDHLPGDRFCANCGHCFDAAQPVPYVADGAGGAQPVPPSSPATEKKQSFFTAERLNKAFALSRYLPAALFALFALLLFAFFAAPVAVMPGGELMGETIAAESYGNVYSMMREFPSLTGSMTALIVFAALALALAAVCVAQYFAPPLKGRAFSVRGKTLSLETVLNAAACLMLFLFFLVGCIVCGTVAKEDGGMGAVKAGACPVLLIVFGLIFLVLCAGIPAARHFLPKKFPALQSAAQAERTVRDETRAKQEQERAAYCETHAAPLPPEPVEKPARLRKEPGLKTVESYIRFKRGVWLIFPLLIAFILIPFFWDYPKLSWLFIGLWVLDALFVLLYILFALVFPVKKYSDKKIKHSRGANALGIFWLIAAASVDIIAIVEYIMYPPEKIGEYI